MSHKDVVEKIIKRIQQNPTATVSSIALVGLLVGIIDPSQLPAIASGLGTNALSSWIDNLSDKDNISDADIDKIVEKLNSEVKFDDFTTQKTLLAVYDRMMLEIRENQLIAQNTFDDIREIRQQMGQFVVSNKPTICPQPPSRHPFGGRENTTNDIIKALVAGKSVV